MLEAQSSPLNNLPLLKVRKYQKQSPLSTLGDFRNISTMSTFLLAVAPYIFYNFDTNCLFLIVKPIEVTSGFISKVMKKLLDGATIEIFDILL